MPAPDLKEALQREGRQVERELRRLLQGEKGIPVRLKSAIRHSLLGGGKRLRPILLLWTYDALMDKGRKGAPVGRGSALVAACGLECLHTYSLIHDDLPAMDDDVLRRGRPTCHVAFGEATAILAGDALQALGFGWLARSGAGEGAALVRLAAEAVGPAGMVGGQQEDLQAESQPTTARMVGRIHRLKTANLLAASMQIGAVLAGAGVKHQQEIHRAGIDLGLAFQGADDILDVTGKAADLGKSPGKDAAAGKATWIRAEGLDAARARTVRLGRSGMRRLGAVLPRGEEANRLLTLAEFMFRRDR